MANFEHAIKSIVSAHFGAGIRTTNLKNFSWYSEMKPVCLQEAYCWLS